MNIRKVICDVEDSGSVIARIVGGHITKRELLRVLKAIRLEYRHNVRKYRQTLLVKGQKQAVEDEAEMKAATTGADALLGAKSNGKN